MSNIVAKAGSEKSRSAFGPKNFCYDKYIQFLEITKPPDKFLAKLVKPESKKCRQCNLPSLVGGGVLPSLVGEGPGEGSMSLVP